MSQAPAIALSLLLLFTLLMIVFTVRVRAGRLPVLRQIRAFETLKGLNGRAIEAGRNLHLSLGTGSLVNESTADSLAGLAILDYLAKQAATTGVPPTVSMTDPTVMLYAQNMVQAAHAAAPEEAVEARRHIRWIAPQPAAYAAGVMNLMNIDQPAGDVLVGRFGDEYLLLGETAARNDDQHIGGTSDPNTLPFIYASADETLLGEEIYAAGAYLEKRPAHLGSLMAQDFVRWLIFFVILFGIIYASLIQ